MISVIMLTYNRENLVSAAIKSILNQSFSDFEFIIVDNGSTDNSGSLCDFYANQDSRIRVVHRKRGTIGSGRNTGLDFAAGEYIMFVDDDDFAFPTMLEFLHSLVQTYQADIAVCGSCKEVMGQMLPNYIYEECLVMEPGQAVVEYLKRRRYNAAMPTKLLRRELFDKIRFFETGSYDDITVGYRYFAEAGKTVAHGVPQYCFRRHEKNHSLAATSDNQIYPEQLEEYFSAFHERTKYLSKKLPSIAPYARYSEWSYLLSMLNKIEKNHLDHCHMQNQYIRRVLGENLQEIYNSPYLTDLEKKYIKKYLPTYHIQTERPAENVKT